MVTPSKVRQEERKSPNRKSPVGEEGGTSSTSNPPPRMFMEVIMRRKRSGISGEKEKSTRRSQELQ